MQPNNIALVASLHTAELKSCGYFNVAPVAAGSAHEPALPSIQNRHPESPSTKRAQSSAREPGSPAHASCVGVEVGVRDPVLTLIRNRSPFVERRENGVERSIYFAERNWNTACIAGTLRLKGLKITNLKLKIVVPHLLRSLPILALLAISPSPPPPAFLPAL
jgi:hypothetical protein